MSSVTLSPASTTSPGHPSVFYRNRTRSTKTIHPKCRTRFRAKPLRAALVEEARPRALPPVRGNNNINGVVSSIVPASKSREDDIQAEAKALARASNASVYSPELLKLNYASRPFKVLRRTLQILVGLGSFGLKLWIDQLQGQLVQNRRSRAVELRETFTRLGPTFVKLGQGLSTRPDLCPPEFLEELSELQDALPTFPDAEAFACIEKELGVPLDSIYSSISTSPIAAASLGQVYKAKLKYSGQLVAVKVQRPGIEEAIGLDFYLIRGLGLLINKYADIITSDVVALIDEFARRVYQELNYVQEGQNARRFKKLYADKEDVFVPDIFWDYTSGKVLTMEWVEGVKLNEQAIIEDPHPGNLLATPEGKLAFLDFGMMSETPEEARFAIIGHVVHMVNRDYEAMARDYYALDFLSPDVDVTPIVPALRNFFDDALNSTVLAASYPYFAKRLLTDPNPYLRDALIELLFKDGKLRWNRLENLLVQGKMDRDFAAKDALQPVLKLVLGPDGEELRSLVIKEAIRVTEAITIGTVIDTYNSIPGPLRSFLPNGNGIGTTGLSEVEMESMLELREQVLRIWGLLRASDNFDPSVLQPVIQVLQEPEARNLGGRVFGGITQRLAARLLQQVLRSPTPTTTLRAPTL
ncbi:unnamed protein product [Lactuca saligna]|uniref:ABC1 atypical kinase-like domain-containing protein n=1 Tax=Lactuca saligna TaxID=75948 RepID=A0AA35ZP33_LACSI|nr:unnamed protein product [Lactuca saligna]